jgi:hypothetical protein
MKRSRIANAFAVVLLSVGITGVAKADNKGCSNDTLRGTFGTSGSGSVISPPAAAGPFTGVLTETFDGKGGYTSTGIISANGAIVPVTGKGTYTVNPDCTGTYTVQLSPIGATGHYYFVLVDSGNGFAVVCTDAGFVFSGSSRRQYPVGDWRQ